MAIILKEITGYFNHPFARLFNMSYAITLISLYIYLRKLMREENIVQRFLTNIGQYSLELYIIHVAIRDIMGTLEMPIANPWIYGICIMITIPFACEYAKIHKKIFVRISKKI